MEKMLISTTIKCPFLPKLSTSITVKETVVCEFGFKRSIFYTYQAIKHVLRS